MKSTGSKHVPSEADPDLPPPAWRSRLRRAIRGWYVRAARDLPWRRTRDPYPVWVSEVMLQQTQVETVRPYYERFLARFPSIDALAGAGAPEVLAVWQGLGYYRRAEKLRAAARTIRDHHGGRFPDRFEDALRLPGVGRYTAGAVLSIAYGQPHPAVDGNVARVLARLLGEDGARGAAATAARLEAAAAALVPRADPGTWTQALMELGALLCTPRQPRCPECPVRNLCRAWAAGLTAMIPKPRPRATPPVVQVAAAVLRPRGRSRAVLGFALRPRTGTLGGFLELPAVDVPPGEDPRAALTRRLTELEACEIAIGEVVARITHTMFNRRALVTAYEARARFGRSRALVRLSPEEVAGTPLTTQSRKILRLIAGQGSGGRS